MRESGILMPVSSLPGPYGIGCFGKEAFEFVDFLAQAGQKIWQILPLSPTGYGDSPYQSCSAFAGNPYFIDLDTLKKEGLLTAAQLKAEKWGTDPKEVDYGTLYVSRFKVLRTAYAAWRKQCAGLHGCAYYFPDDYYAFTLANEEWLDDYALYMALKVANGMKNWVEWDKPYRLRDRKALAAFAAENEEEIGFWKFGYKNIMEVPKLDKIVINMGVGEAKDNAKALESAVKDMETITGQKAVLTRAKNSIANFKIREGMPIGCKVTLRGEKMYDFADRLINLALPRVRDFRGVNPNAFDGRGNYALGIKEQIIFPEIEYDKVDKVRGMDIIFVTTAKTDEEARELLRLFNMPFEK